jgi:hypothetical protein
LLAKHGLTWNDLPAIIADTTAADTNSPQADAAASEAAAPSEDEIPNLLGLVLALLEEHAAATAVIESSTPGQSSPTSVSALVSPVAASSQLIFLTCVNLDAAGRGRR